MHFVQLLSSIFFLIREPLAIWMLMLLGSLYPIYIKRKNRIFCHCEWACSSCQAIEEKGLKCELFPPVPHFELPYHQFMKIWAPCHPSTPDCEFYISQWAWVPSDAETLPPWRVYEFVSDIYFSHHPSHFPLSLSGTFKKSGIFLYLLFFAHFRGFFKTCRECFWVRNFLLFKSSEIPIGWH